MNLKYTVNINFNRIFPNCLYMKITKNNLINVFIKLNTLSCHSNNYFQVKVYTVCESKKSENKSVVSE